MRLNIYVLAILAVSGILIAASCDKNIDEIDINNSEPIKIDLRSSELEMVKSDQQFAFELFSNVFNEEAADMDDNFMISPLSLSMALAMTLNGAEGETKAAIQEALKLGDFSPQEVNDYYKKMREALLRTDPSTKLSIANSIWTNQNVPIKSEFIKTNQDFFSSTVKSVDFSNINTADEINKWAADNTNNLIDNVIDKTDPLTLMYILNAIYFKGIWTSEFDPDLTQKKPFYHENGESVSVDMMNQKNDFYYSQNNTLQMLQLPYGNEAYSMLILLPKEGNNLSDVNSELQNREALNSLKSSIRETEVNVNLPKFKTEYSKRLNDALINMGMGIAFDSNRADFSGMSDEDAFVSFVDQFTYISTDEVGTEAAAVTVVGIGVTSYEPPRTVEFNANKPFIYVIQENSTGSILFMGAVKNFE